ncbi:MAG: hypothetical protein EP346_01715 [Bacteroidetes bacterium]|nr:MAG: hypothetical protein EP346_01715 [Bacteroidota bacterium]
MRSITLTYAALITRIILFAFVATVLSCSPESDMDSRELAYKLEENTQRVFNNARLNGMLFTSGFSDHPRLKKYTEAIAKVQKASTYFLELSVDTLDSDWLMSKYHATIEQILKASLTMTYDTLISPEYSSCQSIELSISVMRNNVVMLFDEFLNRCMSTIDGPRSLKLKELFPYHENRTDSTYSVSVTSDLMYGTRQIPNYSFTVDSILSEEGQRVEDVASISVVHPHLEVSFRHLEEGAYRAYFRLKGSLDHQYEEQTYVHSFEIVRP